MKTNLPLVTLLLFVILFPSSILAQGPKSALRFDGIDDYVFFDTNNRGITNEVTVEAWVKTRATKLQLVTAKYDRDAELGYQLVMRDGKAAFSGRDGSGLYRISGYSPRIINDDKWHHLAGVCKNGTWQIYIDGILESESVTGYQSVNLASNAPFTVGNYYLVNNDYFQGQVDELKIWKRGLSESEIRAGMCIKAEDSNADLVAYLKFDEGSGSRVRDISLYKINGNFRNMNSAIAWVTSGAPIGDKSVYNYQTPDQNSSVDMRMQENDFTFHATDLNRTTQGYHIYYVGVKPNTTTGIADPAQVNSYFGIFQVGEPSANHAIEYSAQNASCSQSLYFRTDNTVNHWSLIKTVPTTAPLRYENMARQAEFAYTSSGIAIPSIQSSGDICRGGKATLQINTAADVTWSTGEKTKTITVNEPGTYTVTLTLDGCTFTDEVTINEIMLPEVNLGPDRTLCAGELATLSAPAGAFTYKWSTGATSSSIEVREAGKYWVEVANSNGCTTRDEITVEVKSEPKFTFLQELTACYGEQISVNATTAGATYLWSTGQTTSTIVVTAPASLTVAITVDGCTYTREVNIISEECPIIPNIITPNGDGKNDTFVLQGINTDEVEIEIFNRWGASVFKRSGYDNRWAGAGSGMYYYHIKNDRTGKVYKGWVEVVL